MSDNREGRAPARPQASDGDSGRAGAGRAGARPSQLPNEGAGCGGARPSRRLPARGVRIEGGQPTIVFVTACTKDRRPWLADDVCHALLRDVWVSATHWLVGRYVIMPDHLHLFVTPGEGQSELQGWMAYWKSQFSKAHRDSSCVWQKSFWDTRLRSQESYAEKWDYVRQNPVRHGLVDGPGDWPYQGELYDLTW